MRRRGEPQEQPVLASDELLFAGEFVVLSPERIVA
jgi:hypothetical protein